MPRCEKCPLNATSRKVEISNPGAVVGLTEKGSLLFVCINSVVEQSGFSLTRKEGVISNAAMSVEYPELKAKIDACERPDKIKGEGLLGKLGIRSTSICPAVASELDCGDYQAVSDYFQFDERLSNPQQSESPPVTDQQP